MKRIYLTGCVIAAFVLSACSQVEQPQPELGPNPVAPAEEEATEEPKEEESKSDDAEKKDDEEATAEQEGEKEHVCSGLLSCKLGLCPNGKKRSEATAANEPKDDEEEEQEDEENITPSEEQMEAARALMAENNKKKKSSGKSRRRAAAEPEETYIPEEPVVASNTSGIPGRSGLRMGHFAPPEEAVSRGDNDSPLPNAVERHGLRSPSLPKSLPMNIDGKTHAH